ncbi:MAG: PHP domain-containing protein [Archaeoglobaceae archaeon]|nr:PHP domain-containing protein [Archaeoglobaceae archaeon]
MFKAELHAHSKISDGKNSVVEILERAMKKGIDIVSITDHDTICGSLTAIDIVESEKIPIFVIPGIEISTSSGHLLAYGITEDVETKLSMEETCKIVKSLGGITALAHPFDFLRKGTAKLKDFEFVDCVEVFNARSYFNFLAKRYAKRYGKKGIGGSDAHSVDEVGLVINYLEYFNKDAILNLLFDGRRKKLKERVSFLLSRISPKP